MFRGAVEGEAQARGGGERVCAGAARQGGTQAPRLLALRRARHPRRGTHHKPKPDH
jgi:hypothetical protein